MISMEKVKHIYNMQEEIITILGSCRQQIIQSYLKTTNIQEKLTYPHYTKEILQQIQFLKRRHISKSNTKYCFRTNLLTQCTTEITDEEYNILNEEFEKTTTFLIEIASRKKYMWKNMFLHHIATEDTYNFYDRKNIIIESSTDEEIEDDILNIQKELYPKKIIIISHFSTYNTGIRYELIQLLQRICIKHNIPFINQSHIIDIYGPNILTDNNHYNEIGNKIVGKILLDKILGKIEYMDSLIVYKTEYEKVRIGSQNDGGYIISNLPNNYDLFISCGIDNNIEFETDFINRYGTTCHAFDGTVYNLPKSVNNLIFNRLNIGTENTQTTTNLKELIQTYENIMLKMDIETYEFRWIDTLTTEELKKFKQMVIEFHYPFTDFAFPSGLDIPTSTEYKMNIFKKIAETHYLIHFHPNTACGLTTYKGYTVPNVFEATYVRKDYQSNIVLNDIPIPHPLDMTNIEDDNDIYLSGYPFSI